LTAFHPLSTDNCGFWAIREDIRILESQAVFPLLRPSKSRLETDVGKRVERHATFCDRDAPTRFLPYLIYIARGLETFAMASANGALSPQSQLNIAGTSPQPSAKRKRAESSEPGEQTNSTSDSKESLRAQSKSHDSQQQIEDFVEILKRCVRGINVTPIDAR
jgi:hypothetical protein